MLVPTTLGAHPTLITMKPAYKKAKVVLTNPTVTAKCGSIAQPVLAFWNKTTGGGGFSDNASLPACTQNTISAEGMMVITLPLKTVTTGTHTITANWDTIIAGWANITTGTCTVSSSSMYNACYISAKAFVYGSAYLLDKNTHKKTALSTTWAGDFIYTSNSTYCYYGSSCTYRQSSSLNQSVIGNFPWLWSWNSVSMLSTNNYSLVMTVYGGASASITAAGATVSGASAYAVLNSATGGNIEKMTSVTIA